MLEIRYMLKKILWYEGDYWEELPDKKTNLKKQINKKQIQIFLEDEYLELLNQLQGRPDISACVLSPCQEQIELLKECIDIYNRNHSIDGIVHLEIHNELLDGLSYLVFRKSNNHTFNIVFFMTVFDEEISTFQSSKFYEDNMFSFVQEKLCIIVSARWMPPDIQEQLLGYRIPMRKNPYEKLFPDNLLKFIKDNPGNISIGKNFKMQRTSLHSVFDKVLYYRQKLKNDDEKKELLGKEVSAPEYCMIEALNACSDIQKSYEIYRNVFIRDIQGIEKLSKDCSFFVKEGAHFDFILCKEDKIHAIIEVDGSYHRTEEERIQKDQLKNEIIAHIGECCKKRFFRFPTDGTTRDEVEIICSALVENMDNQRYLVCKKLSDYRRL